MCTRVVYQCLFMQTFHLTAAVVQWVRALAPQIQRIQAATDLSRKKIIIDSFTAKRSAVGLSVTGPLRLPLFKK